MRTPNPYRPGFNQVPVLLAGREDVLSAIDEALDVAALDARTPRPLIVTGTRGVGKTVVLDQARSAAGDRHSWLSAAVEVQPGRPFIPLLRSAVVAAQQGYEQQPPGRSRWKLTKATMKADAGVVAAEAELTRSDPPKAGTLHDDLEQLMATALHLGAGLLVTIDEAHLAAKEELGELAAALQHAVGQNWPLVAVIAGLPSIQSPKRMVTYLERGEWHTLGLLQADDARDALAEPAHQAGRPMDPEAVEVLAAAAGGYPYAIQVFGHHSWRRSHGQPTITVDHAIAARSDAERDMANGLYSSRWNDSSTKEQSYLVALAQLLSDGKEPTGADVARQMAQPAQAVSYLRERLLKKGTIYSEGRSLRMAVPGMTDWVIGQVDYDTIQRPLARNEDSLDVDRLDADRTTFRIFLDELPSNGETMMWLYQQSFGESFEVRLLHPLDHILRTWRTPERSFHSPAVQTECEHFLASLKTFLDLCGKHTFSVEDGWQKLYPEMDPALLGPDHFVWKALDSLDASATAACEAHSLFVREARYILGM